MNVSDGCLSLAVTTFYSLSRTTKQQVAVPDSLRIFLIGARIIFKTCQVLEICRQIKLFIYLLKHHAIPMGGGMAEEFQAFLL
jgi:hypothetical protein